MSATLSLETLSKLAIGPTIPISKEIHAMKYRQVGESFEQAMKRIARTLSDTSKHEAAFEDILLHQRFLPAGRVQSAIGSARNVTAANCFVSGTIEDNSESIMQRASEAFYTMRMGGGIGYDFSLLRPRNEPIKSLDSHASGPVSFMGIYDAVCATVASAGHRRGAQMGVLRVDHPDIFEFVSAKTNTHALRNFNVSVAITDEFMNAVRTDSEFTLRFGNKYYDTINARELWHTIMRATWDWAEPGVLFIDRINEMNNLWYCENISATNPCLAEGTLVSTRNGFIPVEDVKKGDVIATVMEPGHVETVEVHENEPVYKVKLSDGTELRATAAHIFHVAEGKWFNSDKRLDQLKVGDRIRLAPSLMPENKIDNPFHGMTDREYGMIIGLVIGDGCYTEKSRNVKIAIRNDEPEWIEMVHELFKKFDSSAYISDSTAVVSTVNSTKIMHVLDSTDLGRGYSHQKALPLSLLNSNAEFLAGFIDGMISTDGNISMNKTNPMVRITSTSKESLMMIKRALSCFGVLARVYSEGSKTEGTQRLIEGRTVTHKHQGYVLVILGDGLKKLHEQIGVSRPTRKDRLKEMVRTFSLTGCTWVAEIKSIEPDGYAKVYDLFEPETDTWIAEGVVHRGCGEQPLPPYGACLLGSVNLVKYVEYHDGYGWRINTEAIRDDMFHVVRAMDKIHDVTTYPLREQHYEGQAKRRMGLGVTGMANAIERMGFEYGSEGYLSWQSHILEVIRDTSYEASVQLAKEKGSFPMFDRDKYLQSKFVKTLPVDLQKAIYDHGIRNSHLTSIAPTGTISLSADNVSSGIEPVFSYSYDRTINTPTGQIVESVEDYGVRVFGTKGKKADDCSVDDHVNVLINAAKYVDSAVSKTCNIGEDVSFEEFENVYMKAWQGRAKGCTTFRAAGKRMGILKAKKEEDVSSQAEGAACYIDPETGIKTCEG